MIQISVWSQTVCVRKVTKHDPIPVVAAARTNVQLILVSIIYLDLLALNVAGSINVTTCLHIRELLAEFSTP
jgi:hypothetical protein